MTAANFQTFDLDRARRELSYDPMSGKLTWMRPAKNKQRLAGDEVGFKGHTGYIRFKFKGQELLAHRVIWALMTGDFPTLEVDHINGDRNDNRWSNLRLVTLAQQRANSKLSCKNSSGFNGVCFNKRICKWRAYYRRQHLGYFDRVEDAVAAARKAFDEGIGPQFRRAA